MQQSLVIWGAGGHALVVADILRLMQEYELVGFLDDVNASRHNTEFSGSRILGGREQLEDLQTRGVRHLVCAIGHCSTRMRLAQLASSKGFTLVRAIHPRAT